MIQKIRTIIQTLMFVTIMAFAGGCYYMYEQQNMALAGENHIALPDFEHTNNQQFLDNVNQCVDYWYHNTTDVYPVNRELLLAYKQLNVPSISLKSLSLIIH